MSTPLRHVVARHRYAMAGLVIVSELTLPELEPASLSGSDADVVAVTLRSVEERPECAAFDGTPRFVPHGAGARLVVPDLAEVTVRGDGSGIDIAVWCDASPARRATLSHLVVDHAVARLLGRRGETVLHATCVSERGAALAFLGATGTGKSTIAMAMCAAGAALVADDCLVARADGAGATALVSYPSGRLLADSAAAVFDTVSGVDATPVSRKVRCVVPAAQAPQPLAAVVQLVRSADISTVRIETLGASAALWTLASHTFAAADGARSDGTTDQQQVLAAVGRVRWLAEAVPVLRVEYPSDLAQLPEVCAQLRGLGERLQRRIPEEVNR